MLQSLESLGTSAAQFLPLELFLFFAGLLEEIIPPIPAFPLTILSGSLASLGDYTYVGIFIIALCGAVGKTLGATIVYFIVDRLEGAFVERFGHYFGIQPGDLERFGTQLGKGARDYLILTLLRATPIVPSALLTVGSGAIRIPLTLYVTATFVGSVIRYSLFVYIGFVGAKSFIAFFNMLEASPLSTIILFTGILSVGIWLLYRFFKQRSSTTT